MGRYVDDISGCFNQLHWSQESAKLMGFILEAGILMITLTCGFGVGVTPMVWSLIGDAMNRVINIAKLCRVFSFVDDYMGAGSKMDALASQELTHTVIRGVVDYEGLSVKKNVLECLRCVFTAGVFTVAYRENKHTQKRFALLFGNNDFTVTCKMGLN